MRKSITASILLFSLAIAVPCAADSGIAKGDIVYSSGFGAAENRRAWSEAGSASWVREGESGTTVLKASVPRDQAEQGNMITLPFDLSPYRGMKLGFRCRVKARNVSRPAQPYLGVKFMLSYESGGGSSWLNQNDVYGTFGWKEISFEAAIPDDAANGRLFLGLQGSSGTAWFDAILVQVISPGHGLSTAAGTGAPPYKGHSLPRLRGAMSPVAYAPEDLRVLGREWKANLIRWQLVRAWGVPGTDRDLAEYDEWIASKCAELVEVLEACKTYGIKAVIDLHSPPGGRYQDNAVAMFYEKRYNDHFVETWRTIASRFKGHPALWAYDLVNEPVQTGLPPLGLDFLETQERAARAIRQIDPDTAVIIAADEWDGPGGFRFMTPLSIPNIVYQVHMYVPHAFTHQGVSNAVTGVRYPGMIDGRRYDKEALRSVLEPVREFQQAYNVHIYVGEFSAIRWAPGAADYLRDCIDLFEEYDWDWSYHAFREWSGWSVEYENTRDDRSAAAPTDRQGLLLSWFDKNERP
jgi:endoglucanase